MVRAFAGDSTITSDFSVLIVRLGSQKNLSTDGCQFGCKSFA